MLSIDEARARLLDGLHPVPAEVVPVAEAWGRITAAPVVARLNQPPADVSAMDGYALYASDGTLGARLRVVGAAPAGHPWTGRLAHGEALRLFTGSVMPEGADTVLLQEDAQADGDLVEVREAVTLGRHIRRRGQDFSQGDVLLPVGRKLTARDIGLAAAGNHPWISVHRRPRVSILATGDEIALPGEPIPPGGIVSSNAHALAAFVRACGGDAVVLPTVRDDADAIAAAGAAAAGADLLLTTGGASVGEHDLVQAGLGRGGLTVDFWKIAMRPGKPLMFGRLGPVPVLGLPGNPVSALVCAVLFAFPALARLSGLPATAPPTQRAVLAAALPENDRRADHLRATLTPPQDGPLPVATPFQRQDSAMLRLLAHADALVVRPPHAPAAPAGAEVPVIALAPLGL
jgi:molybdopterin molybdotransferase